MAHRRIPARAPVAAVALTAALLVPSASLAGVGGSSGSVTDATSTPAVHALGASAATALLGPGIGDALVPAARTAHALAGARIAPTGHRAIAFRRRARGRGARRHALMRTATRTTGVARPGEYRVAVRLVARNHRVRKVHLLIGSVWRTVKIGASHHAVVRLLLHIHGRTLTVLAQAIKIRPRITILLRRRGVAAAGTPATSSTTPAASSAPTTPAATTSPSAPDEPSGIAMPAVPTGWHSVFSDNFSTPTAFGTNPPGWYGPYSDGTGDTSNRAGQGNGIWLNSQSVMVGPGASGDGYQVPAGVLDIWQHVANGVPISGVLIPDAPDYNADQGLTSECVTFVFRVVNPAPGWKMVPLLWDDPTQPAGVSAAGDEEIDSPEIEFTPDTVTTAIHFSDGDQVVPYFGLSGGLFDYSLVTGSYGINITNWTEWQTCRTPGQLTVAIDGQTVFTATSGETFNQWGDSVTATIPDTSMHWVLQTETSTLADNQPAASSADHVEFDWVQITAPGT